MAILSPDEARRMARMEFAIVVQTDLCAFLNAAQNFPNMSKENICLLILQFPDATDLLTETEWRQCGSTLLPNAQVITLITDEKMWFMSMTSVRQISIPQKNQCQMQKKRITH